MYTIKCNVVGGYDIRDLGKRLEHNEVLTITDEQYGWSKDVKTGESKGFLQRVKHWFDRKSVSPTSPVQLQAQVSQPPRKQNFAPSYPPTIQVQVPIPPTAPDPTPPSADSPDVHALVKKGVEEAIQNLIKLGVLVPAGQLEAKLDQALSRPVQVINNSQAAPQTQVPIEPEIKYIPSQIKDDSISATIDVKTTEAQDTTQDAAALLKAARSGKTPIKRPWMGE